MKLTQQALKAVFAINLALLSLSVEAAPDSTPLRVGVTADFPPMIYKDAGKLVGLEADFAKVLGEELGRPIKLVEVRWEDQISALADGKTDIIMSSMSMTRARQLRVSFSKPYLTVGQTVLV